MRFEVVPDPRKANRQKQRVSSCKSRGEGRGGEERRGNGKGKEGKEESKPKEYKKKELQEERKE